MEEEGEGQESQENIQHDSDTKQLTETLQGQRKTLQEVVNTNRDTEQNLRKVHIIAAIG